MSEFLYRLVEHWALPSCHKWKIEVVFHCVATFQYTMLIQRGYHMVSQSSDANFNKIAISLLSTFAFSYTLTTDVIYFSWTYRCRQEYSYLESRQLWCANTVGSCLCIWVLATYYWTEKNNYLTNSVWLWLLMLVWCSSTSCKWIAVQLPQNRDFNHNYRHEGVTVYQFKIVPRKTFWIKIFCIAGLWWRKFLQNLVCMGQHEIIYAKRRWIIIPVIISVILSVYLSVYDVH